MDIASIIILAVGLVVGVFTGGILTWLILRGNAFSSVASEALRNNSEEFLRLANENMKVNLTAAEGELNLRKQEVENLVKPLAEQLGKMEKVRLFESGVFPKE